MMQNQWAFFFSIAEMILRDYTTVSPSVSDKVDRYIYINRNPFKSLSIISSLQSSSLQS